MCVLTLGIQSLTLSPQVRDYNLLPKFGLHEAAWKCWIFSASLLLSMAQVITAVAKDEYGILCRDLFSLEMGMEDAGACQW